MIDSSQVEKFHKQLIAMQLAGVDVLSQLLYGSVPFKPQLDSASSNTSIEAWQERLRDFAERLKTPEASTGELILPKPGDSTNEVMSLEAQRFEDYQECFRHWVASGEQIQALQYLATTHRANQANAEGTNVTLLYLLIYSSFALIAFLIVVGITLGSVGGLIRHLRLTTVKPLEVLLTLQPFVYWLFAALVIAMIALAAKIAQHSRSVRMNKSDKTYRWLALSQRASVAGGLISAAQIESKKTNDSEPNFLTAPNSIPTSVPSESSPLMNWATSIDGNAQHRTKVLGLVHRLYLWLSNQRAKRMSQTRPQILGALIGGSLALGVGLLLFYPLVQTLIAVIDSAGSQR